MADEDEQMEVQGEEEVEETEVEAAPAAEMDVVSGLKEVLKKALVFDGLRRGLHECSKALDRGAARLCILAKDCDNDEYTRLVQALCSENNVPLIMADEGKKLGEWVGLASFSEDATVRKSVRCSVAVVTDFGEETAALNIVMKYAKSS